MRLSDGTSGTSKRKSTITEPFLSETNSTDDGVNSAVLRRTLRVEDMAVANAWVLKVSAVMFETRGVTMTTVERTEV